MQVNGHCTAEHVWHVQHVTSWAKSTLLFCSSVYCPVLAKVKCVLLCHRYICSVINGLLIWSICSTAFVVSMCTWVEWPSGLRRLI